LNDVNRFGLSNCAAIAALRREARRDSSSVRFVTAACQFANHRRAIAVHTPSYALFEHVQFAALICADDSLRERLTLSMIETKILSATRGTEQRSCTAAKGGRVAPASYQITSAIDHFPFTHQHFPTTFILEHSHG